MAENLTPEMLKLLMSGGQAEYYDPATGRAYLPNSGSGWTPGGGGGYSGQDGFQASAPTEFRGYNWTPEMNKSAEELNGTPYDIYNTQGEQTGTGTWDSLGGQVPNWLPFAMLAAPFAAAMSPALGSAASFGTNPVLGGASASGLAPAAAAGGAAAGGASGGSGLMGSISNGLNSIGTSIGNGINSIGSGISSLFGGGGSELASGAFLGEGMASGVPLWDAAATGAGLSLATPGLLSGAAATGSKKNPLIALAATALAGAAGGEGVKKTTTETERMDPRMDPYIYGEGGLLNYTRQQLDRDMSPERMAERDRMRGVGMGLLFQPVAGNGFNKFFPGR